MANLITVLRTLLAFLAVAMLRWHTWEIYVGAALLTLLVIWMDAWDGWVARRRNETSKAGAVFDILGDGLLALGWQPSLRTTLTVLAYASVYATVLLCVVRGIPVLVEARRFLVPDRAG